MGKNFTRKYTVELDLDTKVASSQVKKLAGDIKDIWAKVGNASDSFEVLKDLVDYLSQIDAKIAGLKSIDANLFDKIFGVGGANIDAALKKAIEPILSSPEQIATMLSSIMTKIGDFNARGIKNVSIAEVRDVADEIKSLYALMGRTPDINLDFTGRVKKEYIDALTDSLSGLNIELDGFFNSTRGGHSSGSGYIKIINDLNTKTKEHIDTLELQKQKYQELDNILKGLSKTDIDFEVNQDNVRKFAEEYKSLYKYIKEYDGDLLSDDYQEKYQKFIKMSSQLMKLQRNSDGLGNRSLRDMFNSDDFDDFDDLIDYAETSLKKGNVFKNAITDIESQVTQVKEIASMFSGMGDNLSIKQVLEAYGKLSDIYAELPLNSPTSTIFESYLDSLMEKILKLASTEDQLEGIKDIFNNFGSGDIKLDDALNQINTILSTNIPNSAASSSSAIGNVVNELEYVQNIAIQLEKLFHNINSMSGTLEYKILINGQEINIKQGQDRNISTQTAVESYLGSLDKNTIVSAHNHPGGTSSNFHAEDIRYTIEDVYGGIAKVGAIISEKDITTLNLAGVKLEDALSALKQIEAIGGKSISADKINEIFASINPDYKNVAQVWDPSQFSELAKYIYDIGSSADTTIDPLTKFQNILRIITKDKIDLSKYESLFSDFKVENAGSIFNQIMSSEGLDFRVEDLNSSSLSDFINSVNKQKEAYVQLRNEAKITYSDIHDLITNYLKNIQSGGLGGEDINNFIGKYFDKQDQLNVSDWLIELENGEASINQITNRIAKHFQQIDPSEYLKDDYSGIVAGTKAIEQQGDAADRAKTTLAEFLKLGDEINSIDGGYTSNDVDIGKFTERLEVAKRELDELGTQGLLTAEELKEVDRVFNDSKWKLELETRNYTGYGNGHGDYDYNYYDEYRDERNRANELEEENKKLREEQKNINSTITDTSKLFEDETGQLSLFENITQSAQKADAEVEELQGTLKQIDGQMSLFDDDTITEDTGEEEQKLERLRLKLVEVKEAIEAKTQAFREEGGVVDAIVEQEIAALQRLFELLEKITTNINDIINNSKLIDVDNPKETIDADIDESSAQNIVNKDYALDSTLDRTNGILTDILSAVSSDESVSKLVDPLNNAVAELKNVASGIVDHQKRQGTNLTDASLRITNDYDNLSGIAKSAVSGLGTEPQIAQMKALADNVVRVEGAVKDADGVWKGFVVDINESNSAVTRFVKEQSQFAKSLNESAEAAQKAAQEVKQVDTFDADKEKQLNVFSDYINKIKESSNYTQIFEQRLNSLIEKFETITDADGLSAWTKEFKTFQDDFSKFTTNKQIDAVDQLEKRLVGQLNTLDFKRTDLDLGDEQKEIIADYQQLIDLIESYKIAVKSGAEVEIDGINQVAAALQNKINKYKEEHAIVDARGGKRNSAYGATAVQTAENKHTGLSNMVADNEYLAKSKVVQAALAQYTTALKNLQTIQSKFKVGENITGDQKKEFDQAKESCSKYGKELEKLIKASQKLDSNSINKVSLGDDFEDNQEGRIQALKDIIQAQYGVSVATTDFTDNWNKCVFAVDNGDGTFTQMTATINATRNAINFAAGEAKEAKGAFASFFDELKHRARSILQYVIASVGIHEVIQVVRQGITYIREIDSALTELKKVTDETDAAYDQFLQNMSKTAGVVGSTVAELTTMAAEWSRLGYSMQESAKLAESTAILLNVSEFENATEASEALISTMQAFQYTADESQHVVDILNEVKVTCLRV